MLMNRRCGVETKHANASTPDHVWLSPEAQQLVCNIGTIDLFPDHLVLAMKLKIPNVQRSLQAALLANP